MTRKASLIAALPLLITLFACGGTTLESLIAPSIVTQPGNQSVGSGAAFGFIVVATGGSINYQWQKLNGSTFQDISGANGSSYSKTSSVSGDTGSYRDVLSNNGGTVISNTVTLTFQQ